LGMNNVEFITKYTLNKNECLLLHSSDIVSLYCALRCHGITLYLRLNLE